MNLTGNTERMIEEKKSCNSIHNNVSMSEYINKDLNKRNIWTDGDVKFMSQTRLTLKRGV